ncbi:MAG: peptidylprolyl isomerase [Verrucomicrobiota bacterium]
MNAARPAILRSFLLLVFFASAHRGCGQILADFQTSMGAFTCELKYVESPQAVANFVGLAEGSRPWVDPATGAVRTGTPYYNGVKFHRVIAGFMNQSGSRNGLGTDGPGYTFRDEVTNGLTQSAAGVLSMANSGKNTNGAQFFITVAPQPSLNGGYTIFGAVTSGLSVVTAINAVPKTLNSSNELAVPVTPVVIQSIGIRRIGAAAQAFDINAQNLPVCGGVAGSLKVIPAVTVSYLMPAAQPAATGFQVYHSTDFQSWSKLGEIYQGTGSVGDHEVIFETSNIAARAFYNIPLVKYAGALGPASTASRSLTVT